jgi:hypothetical protein
VQVGSACEFGFAGAPEKLPLTLSAGIVATLQGDVNDGGLLHPAVAIFPI